MSEKVTIVGIFIATGDLKDALAQHLFIAMVDITRIAWVIESLNETANDTKAGLGLAKQQHSAIATQRTTVKITLKVLAAKSCKR